jgi:hypothetical protein
MARELCIQVRQRLLQHLPVPWIARNLQLLQNTLSRKLNSLPSPVLGNLLGRKGNAAADFVCGSFVLLLLNGFAFPSARHGLKTRTYLRGPENARSFSSVESALLIAYPAGSQC